MPLDPPNLIPPVPHCKYLNKKQLEVDQEAQDLKVLKPLIKEINHQLPTSLQQ